MRFITILLFFAMATCAPVLADVSDDDVATGVASPDAAVRPQDQPLDIKNLSKIPVASFKKRPRYPLEMRKAGVTGTVVLAFVITKEGFVVDLTVISATNSEFAVSALECLSKWRFIPGSVNGVPVSCRVSMPMSFNLK